MVHEDSKFKQTVLIKFNHNSGNLETRRRYALQCTQEDSKSMEVSTGAPTMTQIVRTEGLKRAWKSAQELQQ
jgi:hypothetical protein